MTGSRPADARQSCANCDQPLSGRFCSACGQKDLGTRVTLWELIREVIGETFEIEGRLPRTLLSIAYRPGHYLGEFLDGHRKSYASPLRFYLLMLFVSALLLGWRGQEVAETTSGFNLNLQLQGMDVEVARGGLEANYPDAFPLLEVPDVELRDCLPAWDVLPWEPTSPQPSPIYWMQSLDHHPSEVCPNLDLDQWLERVLALTGAFQQRSVGELAGLLTKSALQQAPLLVSFMLVAYAGVLRVLWPRTETTVPVLSSMVLHTLMLVCIALLCVYPSVFLFAALLCWHQLHVLFGLRRAFGSGWLRTLFAYFLSTVVWFMLAVCAAVAGLFLTVNDLLTVFVPT